MSIRIPLYLFIFLLCLSSSCKRAQFYTLEDFTNVQKADVHVHIRTERNTFVEQAIAHNFKLVNIVVDGAGTWEGITNQHHFALFQQNAYPQQFCTVTSFSVEDFHEASWETKVVTWLDSCFEQGAIGVKVWKNIGMSLKDTSNVNIMVDDERLDGVFQHIEEAGKLLVGHLGEPLNCWLPLVEMTTNNDRSYFERHPEYHMFLHPDLPSYEDQMKARDNRVAKHPHLPFVGAHMASLEWNVDTLAAWFDRFPHTTVDLAARMGQVFWQTQKHREKVRTFFITYQDRIMYATDMGDRDFSNVQDLADDMLKTWKRDWQYFVTDDIMQSHLINGEFQGIQLPKAVINKIYFKNAARIFSWPK